MADIVLLSDVIAGDTVMDSRYIGPYVLATQLRRAGFTVSVLDYFTRIPDLFSALERHVDADTLFVGISSTFLSRRISEKKMSWLMKQDSKSINSYLRENFASPFLWCQSGIELQNWFALLRRKLDEKCPEAKIVLGGAKAAGAISHGDAFRLVDYFAISAADGIIVELAEKLRSRTPPRIMERNGLRVLDNFGALKKSLCPETEFTPDCGIQPGEALPLEVSRGCAFNCKFCDFDRKGGTRKELPLLRQELIRNYERFGTTVYNLTDDCFNDSRPKVETTCEMFLSLPFRIEWVAHARVDVAIRFPHTLEMMVESGARGLLWGLESFHPEAARRAGKGTHPDKVKAFLLDAKEKTRKNCLFGASFVVGLPGETTESQRETIRWILDQQALDFVGVYPLMISEYDEKLDQVAVDYSDYSRHPEAHGFAYVEPRTGRWKHSTMTSEEANLLAGDFSREWNHRRPPILHSVWNYPHFRTLGFTQKEIFSLVRNKENLSWWQSEVKARSDKVLRNYFQHLGIH